jgi:type II secretory pathway component PulK
MRLVRYITPTIYEQLQAYMVALPETVALNINSAAIPVLQTINQGNDLLPMDPYAAARLANWRDQGKPFDSIEKFLQSEQILMLYDGKVGVSSEGLSVKSDYFLLRAESEIAGRYRAMSSLIRRDAAGGRVLGRRAL